MGLVQDIVCPGLLHLLKISHLSNKSDAILILCRVSQPLSSHRRVGVQLCKAILMKVNRQVYGENKGVARGDLHRLSHTKILYGARKSKPALHAHRNELAPHKSGAKGIPISLAWNLELTFTQGLFYFRTVTVFSSTSKSGENSFGTITPSSFP